MYKLLFFFSDVCEEGVGEYQKIHIWKKCNIIIFLLLYLVVDWWTKDLASTEYFLDSLRTYMPARASKREKEIWESRASERVKKLTN